MDGEKINSGEQAGPSGNTSTPPEGNSGLPPVYAVVDKNKKTKKPPPKSVSRLTVLDHCNCDETIAVKCELGEIGESNQ